MAKKILIADDEPMILNMLETRLSSAGYEVFKAENGVEAVARAKAVIPDLIIMDILMPKMDGIDATAALAEDPATKKIPIIFLTALQTKEDERVQGNLVGPRLIFAKPFDGKELVQNVQKLIGKSS